MAMLHGSQRRSDKLKDFTVHSAAPGGLCGPHAVVPGNKASLQVLEMITIEGGFVFERPGHRRAPGLRTETMDRSFEDEDRSSRFGVPAGKDDE